MRVAVIGAGPSGLVTLKHLLTAHRFLANEPVEAVLFEAEDAVGGTFSHRTYEEAELVSSKQLTTFSDFRPAPDDPDFLPTARYVRYLNDYCTAFKLWPHIKLSCPVASVRRRDGGGHVVSYQPKESGTPVEWECDAIAVCSGLHVTPNIPRLDGIENVPVVLHSADFKSKAQFGVGKTVLILGSGETGMDVAYMAVNSPTKRIVLSHRDGFLCAPKRVPDPVILPIIGNRPNPDRLNVPVDSSSASLFDTAYVHPRLRDHMILWEYYDFFIKSTLWLVSGTKHGLGQWVGGISDERYHASKIFFNKSNKAMPYISAPYREEGESSIVHKIRSSLIQVPIADTHGRHIDLAPWPANIDCHGVVHFRDNGRKEYQRLKDEKIKPDMVVFATGYTHRFPFLGGAYPTADAADVRDIWSRGDPTVGFIGFVRPSFGAIPPLAELQAQLWVANLLAPERIPRPLLPEDEPHYRLRTSKTARIQYGVDHESYAYQLALDMDAAPSFGEVMASGWAFKDPRDGQHHGAWYKLPLVWALGANFNTKFRLRGPWRWDGASDVLVTELWDTIERRGGFFGHVTLSGLPMLVFSSISLVLYALDPLLRVLSPRKSSVSKCQG
ncbi:hypothetical protein QBC46DRAFT_387095 [Diplogelasinospora grovesii]|uniref:Dimethylaniline monooxygenase n=1 Tax=Diplogelasinospora grovesii TaxID=303347 RepID=A0AAN6S3G7_9PEZI|nr:hypothetical protein QBC46DRAFT_387095 [Diplogelasinospora grovesii]